MSAGRQTAPFGFVVAFDGGRLRLRQQGLQQQLHSTPDGEVCFLSPLAMPRLDAVAGAILAEGCSALGRLPGNVLCFALRPGRHGPECIVARDVVGALPLYVVPSANGPTALSSLARLRPDCPAYVPRVNQDALPEYLLFRHVNGPATLFDGVLAPLPGHAIVWRDGEAAHRRYYALQASFRQGGAGPFLSGLAPRLYDSLDRESAGQRAGVMFSGGLDSSWLAHARPERDLALYTVSFPGRAQADLEAARRAASGLGRELHVVHMEREAYAARLPQVVAELGLPIDHPNYVGRSMLFARAAGDGIERLLSGDGADTIFGGSWHVSIRKFLAVKRLLPGFAARLPLRGDLGRKLAIALGTGVDELIADDAHYPAAAARELLAPDAQDPRASWRALMATARDLPPLERAFFMGCMTAPSSDCAAQTAMAWSAGVGIGYPYLAREILELANGVRADRKLRGFRSKALFRQVARDVVPREIVERKKCGLPVPLQDFIAGAGGLLRYRALFGGDDCACAELLDRRGLDGILARLDRGQATAADLELYWVLLNLELWLRLAIRGERLD